MAGWQPPAFGAVADAIEATWPPAETEALGEWTIRRSRHGGRRNGSVKPQGSPGMALDDALEIVLGRFVIWDEPAYVQLPAGMTALDAELAARGWTREGDSHVLAAETEAIAAHGVGGRMVVRVRAPLAALEELWDAGGIGPARRAVMARAAVPNDILLVRETDRVAGAAFVGVHGSIAVPHAVQVAPAYRRRGLGRALMIGAARWAQEAGADTLALSVDVTNEAALALYESLGFVPAGRYHYRRAPTRA